MSYRQIAVKLPPNLSPERYAAITLAVYSVIDLAGLAAEASVVVDDRACCTDW